MDKKLRSYLSRIGRKGGKLGGLTNKAKGSEYFKAIRAKRKAYPKLGPRIKPKPPLNRSDFI